MIHLDELPAGAEFKFNPLHDDIYRKCERNTYRDYYGTRTSIDGNTYVFPLDIIYVVSANRGMKDVLFVSSNPTYTYDYLCSNPNAKYVTYWLNTRQLCTDCKEEFFNRCTECC